MSIATFHMISVIIPTYNRADILKHCLERLSQQEGVEFEVLVVDDGSTDNSKIIVSKFQIPNTKFQTKLKGPNWTQLHYIHQSNSGQGMARNRGAKEAKGDIVLFIGDDILVEPGFLMQHADAHARFPEEEMVCLGYTTWDPELEISDYMRFLESSGWQFGYHLLRPGFTNHPEPWKFFYTSNISMKKAFFLKEQFDETFRAYGWEDIELGFRLWNKHGMRLYYEPDACALHHHFIPDDALEKRMQKVGRSALPFQKLHPEADVFPTGLKAFLISMATNSLTLPLIRLFGKELYFKFKSWRAFFDGVDLN